MGGMSGQNSSRVEMDMPHFPSGDAKRCVLRLRYNITTTDYDPLTTDSDSKCVPTTFSKRTNVTKCLWSFLYHSAGKHDRGPFFRLIRSRLTGSI